MAKADVLKTQEAFLRDGFPGGAPTQRAVQADGSSVTTIEGMASADGGLHPIQEAFWEEHGLQCGYCTPGMVMASAGLLEANPSPSAGEVRQALKGNLCRCTGYQNIVKAILASADMLNAQKEAAE